LVLDVIGLCKYLKNCNIEIYIINTFSANHSKDPPLEKLHHTDAPPTLVPPSTAKDALYSMAGNKHDLIKTTPEFQVRQ